MFLTAFRRCNSGSCLTGESENLTAVHADSVDDLRVVLKRFSLLHAWRHLGQPSTSSLN